MKEREIQCVVTKLVPREEKFTCTVLVPVIREEKRVERPQAVNAASNVHRVGLSSKSSRYTSAVDAATRSHV